MARREYEVPKDTIDMLSQPTSPPARTRPWEVAHAAEIHTYRGIPEDLHRRIKAVAKREGVPVGDVARALLEYGLEAIHAGSLVLEARVIHTRKTLYPDG